jgi:hypothetical protein
VAADVEHEVFVADGAADAAHVNRFIFDDEHRGCFFREALGGRQTRRSRSNNKNVHVLRHGAAF